MAELYKMRERPPGFLVEPMCDQRSEHFDYIRELHEILWRFVRAVKPSASGKIEDHIPWALWELEYMRERGDARLPKEPPPRPKHSIERA